jgi:hypothetical protein
MESELDETDGAAFAGARDSLGLVAAVDTTWNYTTHLSTALTTLLMDATAALIGDEVFRGRMELDGTNSAFALEEAAGVPAAVSGFLQGATWTAMGEAGDTLVMGGTLTYEPVRWLSAIAETQAETSPEDALVEAAQCQAVALALVEAADGPTHATCEEECLIDLCEQAVVSIWPDVSESGTDLSSLQLGISGEAILTGAAQVAEMEGTWVGRRGEEESSLKGPARAAMIVR